MTRAPAIFERAGRAGLVDEADRARLGRVEAFAGQCEAAGHARPDAVNQKRDDRRRGDAPAHFGDPEDRIIGGDRDVAGCGEPDAAAKAAAMDQRDGRARTELHGAERGDGAAREFAVLLGGDRAQAVEERKIGAGLEVPSGAAQYDGADGRVAIRAARRSR